LPPGGVSADGSKIFFISPDPTQGNNPDPSCAAAPHLYMRLNDGSADASTVDLGPLGPGGDSAFLGATSDGAKVLMAVPGGLALYDTAARHATQIADVEVDGGVLSGNGSTVYFGASEDKPLTGDAPAPSALCSQSRGSSNCNDDVYRYDVADGSLHYLFQANTQQLAAQVTPDGAVLVFGSQGITGRFVHSYGATEMYRYQRSDGSLQCLSCRPDGAQAGAIADYPQLPSESMLDNTSLLVADG
jgi:hypothetical protein